ncbi:MAG: alpha/beta fold hydrolase [Tannerellaceae bacterium]|jgi:fermentation-respiration switch protein FrsA (DUF1100 family)|nr:alpha/beta fold hydrolase [Tannerellaceae bacterium]
MKKHLFLISALLFSLTAMGQDITGDWNGVLKVQGVQLRLVFHISRTGEEYQATMDSPDQMANGISVTSVSYVPPVLKLSVANIGMSYEGTWNANGVLAGTFRQGGVELPLDLSKASPVQPQKLRPQEPHPPYPYYEEEVSFENPEANIRLAGTLTLPAKTGVYPAVVLINGSGQQNRNEEIVGHKPFLVLSDYLTRNGIAVLRYDDRGTASSTGNFETATTLDLSYDTEAALHYLRTRPEIDANHIGLIGHSEGGVIAPMIAARSPHVSFLVLMAGTGIPGDSLLIEQHSLLGKAYGMSEETIEQGQTLLRRAFDAMMQSPDAVQERIADYPDINTPWVRYFIRHNPAETLRKVRIPVLAINGEKDLQVPPRTNLPAIRKALEEGGNRQTSVKELPGLNHLFQECETGSPAEYESIEQTISPVALNEILTWIKKQTRGHL